MFISKWIKALLFLRAGRVTLPYPFVPRAPSVGFRGQFEVDGSRCIGCGECAAVCPPRLITLVDDGDFRVLRVDYSRCTYCARCADVCPEGAIRLGNNFGLAASQKEDLTMTVTLKMANCSLCGRPFATERLLRKTGEKLTGGEFCQEATEWLSWCPECRKTKQAKALGGVEEKEHVCKLFSSTYKQRSQKQ